MDPDENDDQKMLCYCLGVRYQTVVRTIRERQCRTVDEVTRWCRAGGACRSCHPEIADEIRKWRAQRGGVWRALWQRLFGARS